MKFSSTATAIFAATAIAVPLAHEHNVHKRDLVTEYVHQTIYYYQKQVVYVDQNGTPFSTGTEVVGTSVEDVQPTTTAAQAAATSDSVAVEDASTTQVIIYDSAAADEPQSSEASASSEASVSTQAAVAPSSSTLQVVSSSSEAVDSIAQLVQTVVVSSVPVSSSEPTSTEEPTTSEAEPTTSSYEEPEPTSTSVYEAPETSTTAEAEPTTSSYVAPTTTSEAAVETSSEVATSTSSTDSSSSTDSGSSGDEHEGDGTYYDTGLGACGITSTDSDYIVAISHVLFDAVSTGNPNTNPLCGKKIRAYRGSKSVEVTVVDRCPGCDSGSLDFSPAAFDVLGDEAEGRIPITWSYIS